MRRLNWRNFNSAGLRAMGEGQGARGKGRGARGEGQRVKGEGQRVKGDWANSGDWFYLV